MKQMAMNVSRLGFFNGFFWERETGFYYLCIEFNSTT